MSPFDPKAFLLAKHAQHVVLIHFPIALLISAVGFDLIAHRTRRSGLLEAAYFNLAVAAISSLPVLVTGILAWRFQLEGQKLKGILLEHLLLGSLSTLSIWAVWWIHFRSKRANVPPPRFRFALEIFAVGVVVLTAHLGGFLSGVNGPG